MDTDFLRGLQHHKSGELDHAERLYRSTLSRDPEHADALHLLGVIALSRRSYSEAVELMEHAARLDGANPQIQCHLGLALDALNRTEEAIAAFRRALALDETISEAAHNLALTFHQLGRLEEAVDSYQHCLKLNPGDAETWCNLGAALKGVGRPEEAIYAYHRALEINPAFPEAAYNLGNVLQEQRELGAAADAFRRALEIRPDFAAAACNLGNTLKEAGHIDSAIDAYRRALDIDRAYADAHRMLAFTRTHTEHDEYVSAMEKLFANSELPDGDRIHLGFALGKAYEELGLYDQAFEYLRTANGIKRATFDYDIEQEAAFFVRLREAFNEELLAQPRWEGCDDLTPIFVLGMPRSGTTLVEQILASHPQVFGAGELSLLGDIAASCSPTELYYDFPPHAARLNGGSRTRLGMRYVEGIRRYSPDSMFIVDKKPANFQLIGLIRLIMPDAKIIHCRRDPMDNCLSIFKNFFAGANSFAYDLEEIGRYYRLYEQLMEHWRRICGETIFEIRYEDLVGDQRRQTEKLLANCELPWDDACMEFYKTARPVRTASAVQVRKPIFTDSVQHWRRYEGHLAPLRRVLEMP